MTETNSIRSKILDEKVERQKKKNLYSYRPYLILEVYYWFLACFQWLPLTLSSIGPFFPKQWLKLIVAEVKYKTKKYNIKNILKFKSM